MVDPYAIDCFSARNLAKPAPALHGQPRWKIRYGSNDFDGIAGAAREMLHALMDENSLEGIELVGVESCERQNSQAQSIEMFSCRIGETSISRPKW